MHATIKGCFETETMKHCAETDKHSEGRQRETKHKTIKIVPILQSGSGPATSLAVGKKTQTVNEIGHLNRRSHKHCHAFDALLRRYILRRCRSRPFFVFKKVTELFPSVNMFSLGGRKKASKPGSKLASKQAPCAREPSSQTPTAPLVPEHHLRAPWPRHERCWSTLHARIKPEKVPCTIFTRCLAKGQRTRNRGWPLECVHLGAPFLLLFPVRYSCWKRTLFLNTAAPSNYIMFGHSSKAHA